VRWESSCAEPILRITGGGRACQMDSGGSDQATLLRRIQPADGQRSDDFRIRLLWGKLAKENA
jgi:hypothetical protein